MVVDGREPGRAAAPSSRGLRPRGQHRVQELRRIAGMARLSARDHGGRNLVRRGAASTTASTSTAKRTSSASRACAGARGRPPRASCSTSRSCKPGDFVVHIDHGIGAYRGLKHLKVAEHRGRLSEPRIRRRRHDVRAGRAHQPGPALRRRRRRGAQARQARAAARGTRSSSAPGGGARDGLRAARHLRRARSAGGPRLSPSGIRLRGIRRALRIRGDARPTRRDRRGAARHVPRPSRWTV